jgi:Leucine-rich repeat (LRR) protein
MRLDKLQRLVMLAISITLLGVTTCSKSSTGGDDDGDDGNTPYMIVDVAIGSVSDSSVTLTWTATGDDADQGTASVYDIRRHHAWISSQNWDSATQVIGEPAPKAAGQTETFEIRGLHKDSSYFFALKVADEAGNWTNQSNCVMGTCFDDFEVSFADHVLDSIIRVIINKPTGAIHRSELLGFNTIDANDKGVTSIDGLEYCSRLEQIFMSMNQVTDIGALESLPMLRDVQFVSNNISNIGPLYGALNIERLILRGNDIVDISVLAYHYRLRILELGNNSIIDLSPLVTNLALAAGDTVYLHNNPLSVRSIDTLIPQLQGRGLTVLR